MEEYGLVPGRYFLQITRFEPDNLPLENALAFRESGLAAEGFAFLLVGRSSPTTTRLLAEDCHFSLREGRELLAAYRISR
jgi:hypothetical protein